MLFVDKVECGKKLLMKLSQSSWRDESILNGSKMAGGNHGNSEGLDHCKKTAPAMACVYAKGKSCKPAVHTYKYAF